MAALSRRGRPYFLPAVFLAVLLIASAQPPPPPPPPPTPTSRPTPPHNLMPVTSGTALFKTYHSDSACSGANYNLISYTYSTSTATQPLKINTCFQDGAQRNIILRCKMSAARYTLTQTIFTDATCSSAVPTPATGPIIFEHGQVCRLDQVNGGWTRVACGQDSKLATWTANLGTSSTGPLPVLYDDASCSSLTPAPGGDRKIPLGVCTPRFKPNFRSGTIDYNYVLSLNRSPMGDMLEMRKYASVDRTCSKRLIAMRPLHWKSVPAGSKITCIRDHLVTGKYFKTTVQSPSPPPTTLTTPTTPTAAPYGTTYYALVYSYSDAACASPVYREEIIAYGLCVAKLINGAAQYYYRQIVTPALKLDVLIYSTSDCSGSPDPTNSQYGLTPPPFQTCYSNSEQNGALVTYRKIASATTTMPSLIYPGSRLDQYLSAAACAAALTTFPSYIVNYVTNVCFPNWAQGRIVYDQYPTCVVGPSGPIYNYTRYTDSTCHSIFAADRGIASSNIVVPTCYYDSSAEDSSKSYDRHSCFSPGPTMTPSAAPTNPTMPPSAAPTINNAAGYIVSLSYANNAACSSLNGTQITSFTAFLVGACVPDRNVAYNYYSIVTYQASLPAYTTTYYSDAACSQIVPPNTMYYYEGSSNGFPLNTGAGGTGQQVQFSTCTGTGTGVYTGATTKTLRLTTALVLSDYIKLPNFYMTLNYLSRSECTSYQQNFVFASLNYIGLGCTPYDTTSVKRVCGTAGHKITTSLYSGTACAGEPTSSYPEGGTCYSNTNSQGQSVLVYSSDFWNPGTCPST